MSRGNVRAGDYERKRAAFKRVAARVLAERPVGAGSWNAVAREMGINPSGLAYYWGNMDNLLWSLMWDHLRVLLDEVGQAAGPELPPRERIVAICRAYCQVMDVYGPEHRVVLTQQARLSPARRGDLRQIQRWILEFVAEAVASGLPELERWRAAPLALTLLSMLNGHGAWFRRLGAMQREAFAEMVARMVLSELPAPVAEDVADSSCNGASAPA